MQHGGGWDDTLGPRSMCVDRGKPQNGATSGATLETYRGEIRMNARSAADWKVMIEPVAILVDETRRLDAGEHRSAGQHDQQVAVQDAHGRIMAQGRRIGAPLENGVEDPTPACPCSSSRHAPGPLEAFIMRSPLLLNGSDYGDRVVGATLVRVATE